MDENEVKQEETINANTTNSIQEKSVNVCGLLSFIFSLIGLFILGYALGAASIVLGIIGIVRFDPKTQKSKWMAIAGLCVGVLDIFGLMVISAILRALM